MLITIFFYHVIWRSYRVFSCFFLGIFPTNLSILRTKTGRRILNNLKVRALHFQTTPKWLACTSKHGDILWNEIECSVVWNYIIFQSIFIEIYTQNLTAHILMQFCNTLIQKLYQISTRYKTCNNRWGKNCNMHHYKCRITRGNWKKSYNLTKNRTTDLLHITRNFYHWSITAP